MEYNYHPSEDSTGGYICSCGEYVPNGYSHICREYAPSEDPFVYVGVNKDDEIIELLAEIKRLLELILAEI